MDTYAEMQVDGACAVGASVCLQGLSRAEFNGRHAIFERLLPDGRCEVHLQTQRLSVKIQNVQPLQLCVVIASHIACSDHVDSLTFALESLVCQEVTAHRVFLSWHCQEDTQRTKVLAALSRIKRAFPVNVFHAQESAAAKTQFEHFAVLHTHAGIGQDAWIIFHDDDGLSCPSRLAHYCEAISSIHCDTKVNAVASCVQARFQGICACRTCDVSCLIGEGQILINKYVAPSHGREAEELMRSRQKLLKDDLTHEELALVENMNCTSLGEPEIFNLAVRADVFRTFFSLARAGALQSPFCDQAFYYMVRYLDPSEVNFIKTFEVPDPESNWMYMYRRPDKADTHLSGAEGTCTDPVHSLGGLRILDEDKQLSVKASRHSEFYGWSDKQRLNFLGAFRSNLELGVMMNFWMARNPKKEELLKDMKASFREKGRGPRLWQDYLKLHDEKLQSWLLDITSVVFDTICRRVGLLEARVLPSTSQQENQMFKEAATLLRKRMAQIPKPDLEKILGPLHDLVEDASSTLGSQGLSAVDREELAKRAKDVQRQREDIMLVGQASSLITKVAGFCNLPLPELRDEAAQMQRVMGTNIRLTQLATHHYRKTPESVPGELVRTICGGLVDVHSALSELAEEAGISFDVGLDEVLVCSAFCLTHSDPFDSFGFTVPVALANPTDSFKLESHMPDRPAGMTTFVASPERDSEVSEFKVRPRKANETVTAYMQNVLKPHADAWRGIQKDAGWDVNQPEAIEVNGSCISGGDLLEHLDQLANSRAPITCAMTLVRKRPVHGLKLGMSVVLHDISSSDEAVTQFLLRSKGHKVVSVTGTSFAINFDSVTNKVTLGANAAANIVDLKIDHKGRWTECSYGPCHKKTNLKLCTGCGKVKYCSSEHSQLDWKYHQDYCAHGQETVGRKRVIKWMREFLADAHDVSPKKMQARAADARAFNELEQRMRDALNDFSDETLVRDMPQGSASSHRSGRRILPNVPCPCGGGMKYKKCCGKRR